MDTDIWPSRRNPLLVHGSKQKGQVTMSIWSANLATEDGAWSASQLGGYACFVAAALALIWLFLGGQLSANSEDAVVAAIVVLEFVLYIIAGFRLNAGQGIYLGSAACVFLALELFLKIILFTVSIAAFVNVLLLIVAINGVRGARALRSAKFDDDDAVEALS